MLAKQMINLCSSSLPFQPLHTRHLLALNSCFRRRRQLLADAECWNREQLELWQLSQLKMVMQAAASSVPYYRETWRKIGFTPADLGSLSDLSQLPTIDKTLVKERLSEFVNEDFPSKDLVRCQTGGSTSQPMKFFVDRQRIYEEKAYFYYIWQKYGYRIGDPCVLLKGDKLAQPEKDRYWQYDAIYNYLRLDSDYLNQKESLPHYNRKLRQFNSDVLFGFPSSLYQLARLYEHCGQQPPHFRLLLLASENTYPEQLEYLQQSFSADDIFYHYGHSEYAVLAFKHQFSSRLAFVPFYGICELLDDAGSPVTEPGQVGEIVATGFARGMPFIRYRTQDYAVASDFRAEDYMRHWKFVERIEGRLQEFIVTVDKRLVSICTMGAAHFASLDAVLDMQYAQSDEGKLVLKVVENPDSQIDQVASAKICADVERKLENKVRVSLEKVTEIHRSKLGKKSMIEQKLNIKSYL